MSKCFDGIPDKIVDLTNFKSMISKNLKFLRKQSGKSQEEVANDLNIKRTTLSGYENGSAEPNSENLIRLCDYYTIRVDDLLRRDISSGDDSDPVGLGNYISGDNLRVIATTVDLENNDNIELVPIQARAGYTSGYADPDYIRVLPTFQLPFLSPNKKYRTFPIKGDSMPPVSDGSWVIGEYLQNWRFVQDGHPYIVITQNEGIVFKILFNQIEDRGNFLLCSTNPAYEPYELAVGEVLEIWKFTNYISSDLPEPNLERSGLANTVMQLQRDVQRLKNTLR
ncbi:MAG: helix-turn-helix domain-containing protein [Bacteroidetes bacterium]|nr:helix-turn-helix domain-containing protein [Bacteroidota bacterium]